VFVNFNILNQLGSPAINSNTFANRPAAGQTGRLFVSTDTFELYRDNGTTYDLIGGPGSSTITGSGTATQVAFFSSASALTSSANLFFDNINNRLGVNKATPTVALDIVGKSLFTQTETYSTGVVRTNFLDANITVAAGGSFSSPNAITALGATLDLTLQGSATIPSGARSGLDAYNIVSFTGTGTLTHNQGAQIRAYSNLTTGWSFAGSATGTITHLAGLRVLFPDNINAAINITNNYALLLNDQTANTGTVTYTNRFGIYQEGASDLNYFAANTLIGTTVNNGDKLQVSGSVSITNNITAGNFYIPAASAGTVGLADFSAAIQFYSASVAPASDILFYTGGANTMILNESGNLGIGVSPAFKLDVNGTVSNLSNRIYGTNGLAGYLLQQGDWLATAATNLSIAAETGNGLSFFTNGNGTVRAFIPTSGNFLIGTTTDAGQKLQVNGTSKFNDNLDIGAASHASILLRRGVNTVSSNLNFLTGSTLNWFFGTNALGTNLTNLYLYNYNTSSATIDISYTNNLVTFTSAIKTGAPTTGTAAEWKLGSRVAAAVALDATQYIELDVGGTLYKLAIVT